MSTKLKIYFFGLIAHVGPSVDEKKHAVVFKTATHPHRFRLVLQGRDPIPLSADVSFSLAPGNAGTTAPFKMHVPSLSRIVGGTLKEGVDTGTWPDAYYIRYPAGGTLDVASLYGCNAEHQGSATPKPGCIARLTYLEVDTVSDVTITAGSVSETVRPDACVLLANYDLQTSRVQPCGSNPSQGDFAEYMRLLDGAQAGKAIELPNKCTERMTFPHEACSWITDFIDRDHPPIRTSVHIECGNSAYP